jgi:hypothetical protein
MKQESKYVKGLFMVTVVLFLIVGTLMLLVSRSNDRDRYRVQYQDTNFNCQLTCHSNTAVGNGVPKKHTIVYN